MNILKLTLVSLLFSVFSCDPGSRLDYLREFDSFITEVSKDHQSYTDEEWVTLKEKYDLFAGEWYEKYEHELSFKDEMKVAGYKAKWLYCYSFHKGGGKAVEKAEEAAGKAGDAVEDAVEKIDVDKIKRKIKFYVENDMMEDLEDLCKDAEKLGHETEKAVKEILKDMDIDLPKKK